MESSWLIHDILVYTFLLHLILIHIANLFYHFCYKNQYDYYKFCVKPLLGGSLIVLYIDFIQFNDIWECIIWFLIIYFHFVVYQIFREYGSTVNYDWRDLVNVWLYGIFVYFIIGKIIRIFFIIL